MIVIVNKNHFSISEIGYEMMQNITNGLICEKLKYEKQIKDLNDFIKEDITANEIQEHNFMLDYICDKHKELELVINNCNDMLMKWFDVDE
jgi:hypothetical protein